MAGPLDDHDWPVGTHGLERLDVQAAARVTVADQNLQGCLDLLDLCFADGEPGNAVNTSRRVIIRPAGDF